MRIWGSHILLHLRFLSTSTTASVASISTFGSIYEFIRVRFYATMKMAETVDGQNGDGSKSHAPNGTADGQMGYCSSYNLQNNDDEGKKGDENSKATGSHDREHDNKGD